MQNKIVKNKKNIQEEENFESMQINRIENNLKSQKRLN